MNNLFIVAKEGVYRHEVIGVFASEQHALEAAVLAIKRERDGYHTFDVLGYTLGDVVHDGEFMFCLIRSDVRDEKHKVIGYKIHVRDKAGKELELP